MNHSGETDISEWQCNTVIAGVFQTWYLHLRPYQYTSIQHTGSNLQVFHPHLQWSDISGTLIPGVFQTWYLHVWPYQYISIQHIGSNLQVFHPHLQWYSYNTVKNHRPKWYSTETLCLYYRKIIIKFVFKFNLTYNC